jgi:hypothetical protein
MQIQHHVAATDNCEEAARSVYPRVLLHRGPFVNSCLELQLQYTTYKNTLQQLAQKIGDVEQETEEHK